MRNSTGGTGMPTEPTRFSTWSGGIMQNAGPASVMPHEFDTMAWGSLARRASNVVGARA